MDWPQRSASQAVKTVTVPAIIYPERPFDVEYTELKVMIVWAQPGLGRDDQILA